MHHFTSEVSFVAFAAAVDHIFRVVSKTASSGLLTLIQPGLISAHITATDRSGLIASVSGHIVHLASLLPENRVADRFPVTTICVLRRIVLVFVTKVSNKGIVEKVSGWASTGARASLPICCASARGLEREGTARRSAWAIVKFMDVETGQISGKNLSFGTDITLTHAAFTLATVRNVIARRARILTIISSCEFVGSRP